VILEFKKLCILGLGYTGLPTASTFATHGLQVVGVDTNPRVIESLRNGQLHIHEPGLRTLVQASLRSGNLTVQSKPEAADAFIIEVPTPFYEESKKADMSYVISAAESIVPYLKRGNMVVLESTSPPRTTIDLLSPILEKSGLKAGTDFFLAYIPERVLPGQILRELIENARVVGGVDRASAEAGRDLYSIFVRGEIILTDSTTAEMVKLMENTYRDVNIALANEFSRLAECFEMDVWEAIEIANLHPRVNILNPGPGVGGHCISVDPWFLVESAPDISTLIHAARLVNDKQPQFVLQLIKYALGQDLHGARIGVLGLSYKPDVDDFRESPAIAVLKLLIQEGAQVRAYDPYAREGLLEGTFISNQLEEVLKESDSLINLVAHAELRQLTPEMVIGMTDARILIDSVNVWKQQQWQEAGFTLYRLGARDHEKFKLGSDD
jgi:UDP-N-acetyl-D-mannosaminuronic acid dehydrogenase